MFPGNSRWWLASWMGTWSQVVSPEFFPSIIFDYNMRTIPNPTPFILPGSRRWWKTGNGHPTIALDRRLSGGATIHDGIYGKQRIFYPFRVSKLEKPMCHGSWAKGRVTEEKGKTSGLRRAVAKSSAKSCCCCCCCSLILKQLIREWLLWFLSYVD